LFTNATEDIFFVSQFLYQFTLRFPELCDYGLLLKTIKCIDTPETIKQCLEMMFEAAFDRHENPSPFGEICRFETKISDLRESCRSVEFLFWGRGGFNWPAGVYEIGVGHGENVEWVLFAIEHL